MSSTSCFSRVPASARAFVRLSAVWPPMVGSSASGFSLMMISSTVSGVIGPTYVRLAVSGSVMIVAGFELRRITSYPSARRDLQAWVPE